MNYAYWLANITGISNQTKYNLIQQVGSAEDLYFLPEKQVKMLFGMEEKQAERLIAARKCDVQPQYEKLCERGIGFVSLEHESYPEKLRRIPDPPYALYVRGKLPPAQMRSVAIVGARMCSEYGRTIALRLGRKLAEQGICIVSGMARGIDAAGHRGAVEADGVTCAVLGCGVDICYPKSNEKLYGDILSRGCILSEVPPGTQPLPALFPQRNRIISGLCDMVVVVEARERSGSLITADQALEQGRDVYAVPGRVTDSLSEGCNELIRNGAGIIISAEMLLEELGISYLKKEKNSKKNGIRLAKKENIVYSGLDLRPKNTETIRSETGLPVTEIMEILVSLQLKGLVTEEGTGCYALVSRKC